MPPTYPPRRKDLLKDYGWKVRVDIDDFRSTYLRFGSRTLFGEYFKNGRTKFFGSMPNTGNIFPDAAECLIRFIKRCGKINKAYKLKEEHKRQREEVQQNERFKFLKHMR